MPIIRIQKRESPYVQIDRAALEDNRLSWKARGILAYLLSKPDDWSIHLFDIVNHGTEGRDSVRSALKELETFGYAKLELVRSEKGHVAGKEWVICESPTDGFSVRRSSPTDGKTDVGKNRQSGNPLHSNNNNSSNNKHTARKNKTAELPKDAGGGTDLGYSFEMFWSDYGHKVGSKSKTAKAFEKLSEKDRGAIRDTIEAYKRETVTSDRGRVAGGEFKAMRKHPLTYLNGREWETYLDREPEPEIPSEYAQAYQTYQEWVQSKFPQTRQRGLQFSKTQFVQFQKGRMTDVIGPESERTFLNKAHENPDAGEAYAIYQKLLSERLKLRQV